MKITKGIVLKTFEWIQVGRLKRKLILDNAGNF